MSDEKKGLVPKSRFPEFGSEPTWTQRKIGDYLTESRIKGSTGDVARKLTVKLWGNGVHEKQEVTAGSENTQYYRRKAGQFIYSKLDFLNQAFGIVPPYLNDFESTVDLPCFDASNEIDLRFLLEYVQRKDFYKKYGEMADGGRKAKRIQVDSFLSFPIFLPNIKEQQKIADCLSSLDALIRAQADKVDALKTHKKALMQRLFPREGETVPRLRFPEFEDEGEWEDKKLQQLATYTKGFAFKSQDYVSEGTRIIRVSDLSTDFIKSNGEKIFIDSCAAKEYARYQLNENEIIITTVGSKPDLVDSAVGRGIFVTSANQGLLNQNLVKLEALPKVSSRFLFANLGTLKYQKFISSISRGNANQANIAIKELMDFEIYVPSFPEQQKIADCLSSLDELIAAEVDKLEALKTHKKGLMQQLFPVLDEAAV